MGQEWKNVSSDVSLADRQDEEGLRWLGRRLAEEAWMQSLHARRDALGPVDAGADNALAEADALARRRPGARWGSLVAAITQVMQAASLRPPPHWRRRRPAASPR